MRFAIILKILNAPDQENRFGGVAEYLLSHASEKEPFDAAPAVGRDGDKVNVLLGGMVQNLFSFISVPDMRVNFQPLGLQLAFKLFQVLLAFRTTVTSASVGSTPGKVWA